MAEGAASHVRSILVCGLSPESFTREALDFLPLAQHNSSNNSSTQLIWCNNTDAAPQLPHNLQWAESLAVDLQQFNSTDTARFGRMLLVLGAGASTAVTGVSFKALHDADGPYPFDLEALLESVQSGLNEDDNGRLRSPLCVETLRLMARLHEVRSSHRFFALAEQ